MNKLLFLLLCPIFFPLISNAQVLDIHLGDSLTILIPKLKIKQQYLHIKYYRTIVNLDKIIIDVDHMPDGITFGGLQIVAKQYTFYKMRLEEVLLVLNKNNDNADIAQSITYKYGKIKVEKDNDKMWATDNIFVFLYETDSQYCITYKDRRINAQEIKDKAADF